MLQNRHIRRDQLVVNQFNISINRGADCHISIPKGKNSLSYDLLLLTFLGNLKDFFSVHLYLPQRFRYLTSISVAGLCSKRDKGKIEYFYSANNKQRNKLTLYFVFTSRINPYLKTRITFEGTEGFNKNVLNV